MLPGSLQVMAGSSVMWMAQVEEEALLRVVEVSSWGSKGDWKVGFMKNIGRVDSLLAEICSIDLGLDLAWERGFKKVILESDSKQAIGLICDDVLTEHPMADLICETRERIEKHWEVVLRHCYRNENDAANWLATATSRASSGHRILESPPESSRWVLAD